LTIGRKLYLVIFALVFIMVLSGFVGYVGIKKANEGTAEVSEKMALAESAQELNVEFQKVLMPPHDYIVHGDMAERSIFKGAWVNLENQLNEVDEAVSVIGCPRSKELVEEIRADDLPELKAKANEILNLDNPVENPISGSLMEEMDAVAAKITVNVDELVRHTKERANLTLASANEAQQSSRNIMVIFAFGITLFGLAVSFFISKSVAKNIYLLNEGVKVVVDGDLSQRVRVKSRDELGTLANSFNQMTRRLEKSQRELELWGETLEDKVKERTQELVLANKQIRSRVKELTTVCNVSKAIGSTLDLNGLLKRVLEVIAPLAGAQLGAVLLVSEKSLNRCWVYQEKLGKPHSSNCDACPAYNSDSLECWTISGTCCRDEIQGKFKEKITECVKCPVFRNIKLKPVAIYGMRHKDLKNNYVGSQDCICVKTLLELKPKVFNDICKINDYETIFPTEKICSQTCLPLLTKNKVVGVLALATDKDKKLTDKQVSLLESMAYQIAAAIENARLYDKTNSEKIKLDAMFAGMGEGVVTTDKKGKVVTANKVAGGILGVNSIDLIGKNALVYYPKEKRDAVRELINKFKSGESFIKEIEIQNTKSKTIRGNLAPVKDSSNEFLGTILMLQDVTEKERLYKKTSQAAAEFSTLYEVSKVLSSTIEFSDLLSFIIDCSVETMHADIGSIMLLDKGDNELRIVVSRGLSPEIVKGTHLKLGEGIAGWVAEKGKPLLLNDVVSDSRFKNHEMRKELYSAISVPLKVKEEVIGVINIGNISSREFIDDDLRLLSTLTGEAAVSIYNAQLFDELEEVYIETVKAFVETIEAKDSYTRGHSENVTRYAMLISDKLGFSEEDNGVLRTAGLLHDIGKIGIREGILNKPSSLSDEEYNIIKTHPEIGIKIIGRVPKLKKVVPIVLHHHERYDGRGYSAGLKGEEIPLGARILAVADSFDAMTSARPYRSALSFREAVKELKKNTGKQFDPYIVEVFLSALEEVDLKELLGQKELEKSG